MKCTKHSSSEAIAATHDPDGSTIWLCEACSDSLRWHGGSPIFQKTSILPWKPIKTLPNDGDDVLLFCKYGMTIGSKTKDYISHHDDMFFREEFTHWMPLPEPPP